MVWLPKCTCAQSTVPHTTLTKTCQQLIDHFLFFYAFFQNRRGLQLQCAADDVHFSLLLTLLHIWFNGEVYKCMGGEAPQRSLFIESTWLHTSVIAHCCGYLRRVTLRATFISPQHQETVGCTFAHLVDPQVQKKKKKSLILHGI